MGRKSDENKYKSIDPKNPSHNKLLVLLIQMRLFDIDNGEEYDDLVETFAYFWKYRNNPDRKRGDLIGEDYEKNVIEPLVKLGVRPWNLNKFILYLNNIGYLDSSRLQFV